MPRVNIAYDEYYSIDFKVDDQGEFEIAQSTLDRWSVARTAYAKIVEEMEAVFDAKAAAEQEAATKAEQERQARLSAEGDAMVKDVLGEANGYS